MEAEMKMEFTQQASRLQEEFESSKHQQAEALEGSLKGRRHNILFVALTFFLFRKIRDRHSTESG